MLTELDDEPGLLRERDEVLRQEPAVARMLPAHEGLDAVDRAALQVYDRLVMQRQLVALDRRPERGLEVQPLADVGIHPGLVDRGAPLAAALGGVHGHVGVPEQVVGGLRAGGGGHADARRHP